MLQALGPEGLYGKGISEGWEAKEGSPSGRIKKRTWEKGRPPEEETEQSDVEMRCGRVWLSVTETWTKRHFSSLPCGYDSLSFRGRKGP